MRDQCRRPGPEVLPAAIAPQHHQRVVVLLERLVVAHFVGGHEVEFLLRELLPSMHLDIVRLGGNADHERPVAACGNGREDVDGAFEIEVERGLGLLDLAIRRLHRAVVGDGSRESPSHRSQSNHPCSGGARAPSGNSG